MKLTECDDDLLITVIDSFFLFLNRCLKWSILALYAFELVYWVIDQQFMVAYGITAPMDCKPCVHARIRRNGEQDDGSSNDVNSPSIEEAGKGVSLQSRLHCDKHPTKASTSCVPRGGTGEDSLGFRNSSWSSVLLWHSSKAHVFRPR